MQYFIKPGTGIISYSKNNVPKVATLYSDKLIKLLGAARLDSESLTQYHKDIAASVQQVTEEIIFHPTRFFLTITGLDT